MQHIALAVSVPQCAFENKRETTKEKCEAIIKQFNWIQIWFEIPIECSMFCVQPLMFHAF